MRMPRFNSGDAVGDARVTVANSCEALTYLP